MSKVVHYKKSQVKAAIDFIQKNNKHAVRWTKDHIKKAIIDSFECVKEGAWYSGTMGFLVLVTEDTSDVIYVEVLVDPAVSVDIEENDYGTFGGLDL